MKYSFILIAYNEEHHIIASIESILKQKGLGNDYEVIVVDDGSRDKTAELVHEFSKQNTHVRLVGDGKNHGRGYGRYTGVRSASGTFIAMVDADILLPEVWLTTCLRHIQDYDVVGGIAVPDGDVAFVYRQFRLLPKTAMGSTTITGNNGLYKAAIFSKVTFDKHLREGEDVDFNHRAVAAGLKEYCIPGLTVEHQETKSFGRAMLWLYQSGMGATRQLVRFGEIRLPDIAFFAEASSLLGAMFLTLFTSNPAWLVVPLLGLLGASAMHMNGKFYLTRGNVLHNLAAVMTDAVFIACYYAGRITGATRLGRNNTKREG